MPMQKPLPKKRMNNRVDLRRYLPNPVFEQGLLNSCIACTLSLAVEYLFKNESAKNKKLSIMFIYYHMRLIENKLPENVPLIVDESVKSLTENGVCIEELWPYPTNCDSMALQQFIIDNDHENLEVTIAEELAKNKQSINNILAQTPSNTAFKNAKNNTRIQAKELYINHCINELKNCLLQGVPFIFGLDIPLSFFSTPKSGFINIPCTKEKRLGGHAFIALGFDDEKQVFICRNSLGNNFGDNGDCYIPYDFITGSYTEADGTEVANTFSFWYLFT